MITMLVSATLAVAAPAPVPAAPMAAMDHSRMDHSKMDGVEHAKSKEMDCCNKGCCADKDKAATKATEPASGQ